jgi:NADH dehydrogenase [ubiquinone] 1 alpha subcomplex assembly factor 1
LRYINKNRHLESNVNKQREMLFSLMIIFTIFCISIMVSKILVRYKLRLVTKLILTIGISLIAFCSWSIQNTTMEKRIDFSNPQETQNWIIVNDTVMGGRSRASLSVEKNMLVFAGDLSLQNNGGFASIRRIYEPLSWNRSEKLEIKVLGDGRSYQFRLRTNQNADGVAYVANFTTTKNQIQTLQFNIKDFTPQFRGRLVSGAPALNFSDIAQIGFMLADKNPGQFVLQISHIRQVLETI